MKIILGIFILFIIIYLIKKDQKVVEKKDNRIVVLLRIKNENKSEIETALKSYTNQNLKEKRLIILNDQKMFDEYFIDYCNQNDDTDLYSAQIINPYTLKLILKEAKISEKQIVVPIDSNDYFNNSNILQQISDKKIESSTEKDFKNNKIQFFYHKS
jgi:hypothetical protein